MGAFSGMKSAKRGFASNYLKAPGTYMVRIDECAFFEYKGPKGVDMEMWKTTMTVLAVQDGETRQGEVCSISYPVGGNITKQTFQSNLKGFLCSVLECEEDDIGEDETKQCLEAGSPLLGLVCVVTCRMRKSKKSKNEETGEPNEFMVASWSPAMSKKEIKEALEPAELKRFFPNGL